MASSALEKGKWEMCGEFGKRGGGPGEFNGARGITATQPGEIAVADYSNARVVICSNEGQHKANLSLPLSSPLAVAAIHNPEQRLLVVEDGGKYVKVFNMKDNKLAFQFPTVAPSEPKKTEENLRSIAVTKRGTVLVGDCGRDVWTEHRLTDGEILSTVPVQTPPEYLAVDDDTDRVVVSGGDTKKVDVCDSKGTILFTIKPTIESRPVDCQGVCCDSSGIYLAMYMYRVEDNTDTGHIHHYDLDGRFLDCLDQGLIYPQGMTFTSDGVLAVGDVYSIKMYHKV